MLPALGINRSQIFFSTKHTNTDFPKPIFVFDKNIKFPGLQPVGKCECSGEAAATISSVCFLFYIEIFHNSRFFLGLFMPCLLPRVPWAWSGRPGQGGGGGEGGEEGGDGGAGELASSSGRLRAEMRKRQVHHVHHPRQVWRPLCLLWQR